MPFLGQDHRGPGNQWTKSGSSSTSWEVKEPHFGVILDTIPKNHVRKIIEAFLRQTQQKKSKGSYTFLTSAPVSKCSARENIPWLQVGLKGSNECHGYTTFGEMIRRLDLAASVSNMYRFPYLLQVTLLLVEYKMPHLSGSAQAHVFQLVEALLAQVITTQFGIRPMQYIFNSLMRTLQSQSRKKLFSSKTAWLNKFETVRKWQTLLKGRKVPQRMDNRLTLSDMPVELQRNVVSFLNDHEDIISVSGVNSTLHKICEDVNVWRNLCHQNFAENEVNSAITAARHSTDAHSDDESHVSIDFNSTSTWKAIHAYLRKTYDAKEESYSDSLLYCRHCSILFWKDTGHPCITELTDMTPDIQKLSPRQLVMFFET